ncbi:MAG: hypothetical protein ACM3IJ_02390 [Candidatus Levyibacteriota bacterium]
MQFLLFILTALFLTIAFFLNYIPSPTSHPFFLYALNLFFLIAAHPFIAAGLFLATCLYLVRSYKIEKHYPLRRKFIFSLMHGSLLLLVAFFLSFAALLIIAVIELNLISASVSMNPGLVGVTTDRNSIVKTVKKAATPFEIIASDRDQTKIVFAVARAITGTDSFYGKYLLPSISNFYILPVTTPAASMLLLDNTLIFTQINQHDIQAVSPYLSYLFVKNYFSNRPIRHYPTISIMTQKQYIAFRTQDAQIKYNRVLDQIKESDESISTLSAGLKTDQEATISASSKLEDTYKGRETEYKKCYSAGEFREGKFVRKFTDTYCKGIYMDWETDVSDAQKGIDTANKKLADDRQLLKEAQAYSLFYKAQKNVVTAQTGNIANEMGFYAPDKNTLELSLLNTNPHAIADYFENMVHEYLHYASYIPDKRLTDTFFEEGLTEYFARQAIENSLNFNTNLGYPIQVKIIRQMLKSIPETDMADIYFTKDQGLLEQKIDSVYGKDFYKNNRILLGTLQYATEPKQIVQLANTVMKKIGGAQLSEKDVFTIYSSY